jgi:hypothetical protein
LVTVSGAVRALETGQPIAGATVAVGPRQVTTNEAGLYSLINVPVGVHAVWATAEECETLTFPPVLVSASVQVQDFLLRASDSEQARVIGVVLCDMSRNPLPGAGITVAEGVEATSGPLGLFATGSAAAGSYIVSVIKQGYVGRTKQITLAKGQLCSLEFTLEPAAGVDHHCRSPYTGLASWLCVLQRGCGWPFH